MALMGPTNGFSPTQANAFIASRLGVAGASTPVGTALPARVAPSPTSAIIPRPVTALPQPAFPPPSVSVVSAGAPLPALHAIGPALTPGALYSIAQPNVTPNQVATQYGAYQEPVQYAPTVPNVSIPTATDVGTPVMGTTTAFGLTENTWLLILIAAAVVLFLVSK